MEEIFFTITSPEILKGEYQDLFKENMEVTLIKEPNNKYDQEAIIAKVRGFGKVGYVANSVKTRLGESSSSGRIYDKIGDTAKGKVLHILDDGILCELCHESIINKENK